VEGEGINFPREWMGEGINALRSEWRLSMPWIGCDVMMCMVKCEILYVHE
jgi:hypothetical protein